MSVNTQKISDFPETHFKIIAYCNKCCVRHILSQAQYPDISINNIREILPCPTCERTGLKTSIVRKD